MQKPNFLMLQKHMMFLAMVSATHKLCTACVTPTAERKARYDKFGDEGLKGGVPTADGEFLEGYVFHGDAKRVFKDFFGGSNPFAGIFTIDKELHKLATIL